MKNHERKSKTSIIYVLRIDSISKPRDSYLENGINERGKNSAKIPRLLSGANALHPIGPGGVNKSVSYSKTAINNLTIYFIYVFILT